MGRGRDARSSGTPPGASRTRSNLAKLTANGNKYTRLVCRMARCRSASEVTNTRSDSRKIFSSDAVMRHAPGEQDAVAGGGERRHDFLVALPDELPVDRGQTDDVVVPQ